MIEQKIIASIVTVILITLFAQNSYAASEAAPKEETPGEVKFKEGLACYKKRAFKQASQQFWDAIVAGNGGAKVWIYCGHSHAGYGNFTKAREMYSAVIKNHKGTPQGKAAKKYLEGIKDKKDNIVESTADTSVATKKLKPIDPNSNLAKGIKLYKKKDYNGASNLIQKHLQSNPKDPHAYYYLGLVAHYQGNTNKALVNYKRVYELAPDTELGIRAKKILAKFDPKYRDRKTRTSTRNSTVVESGLGSRITIIPPHSKWSHPKVRKATIRTVKDVCRRLPPRINKQMFDGEAKIFIAPNYADKWYKQDQWLVKHHVKPDVYLFEEPSKTYHGKDIWIYECNLYRSSFNAMAPRPQSEIRHNLMHEMGRVLEHLNGDISKEKEVEKLYKSELKRVSGNDKRLLGDLLIEKYDGLIETVAEIIAGLIGCQDTKTKATLKNFPRTTQWIRNRIHL